jgi:ferredoxin
MDNYKIMPKEALSTWVDRLLNREFKVVGPVEKHGRFVYDDIRRSEQLVVEYPITVLPPKKYLLPPRETLFSFNTRTMEMKTDIQVEPTVIMGLHACDMHAITLLDDINDTGYADQHYQARREQIFLVSFECLSPCSPDSFCKSMDTVSVPDSYDLHFLDIGDNYLIQVGSEKGEDLLSGCVNVWQATEDDIQQKNDVLAGKWETFDYRLDFDVSELPGLLGESMGSDVWNELGERCLACGMCTQVCPTCYCFDVTDEVDLTLEEGERVRTWDSCQIDKFAVVAGGHDFRSERAGRQRHRFMRKGKWQYEAYGIMGCVGCGRCATSCLVHITPIDTYNALYAEQEASQSETPQEVQS